MSAYDSNMNIVTITLDTLRYDSMIDASTPNFDRLCEMAGEPHFKKVGAQGTYTLPAHMALFKDGHYPCDNSEDTPFPYNRKKGRLFSLGRLEVKDIVHPTPPSRNIVEGFRKIGYKTIGIGGVDWFDISRETSREWKGVFFEEFHWHSCFKPVDPKHLQYQIELMGSLSLEQYPEKLFFFLNIPTCHWPYRGHGETREGQMKALEFVDAKIFEILDMIPKPYRLLICADHGECFGEDGMMGHGFYHPKVMEVPMLSLVVE